MSAMKGITIKLPTPILESLREEARSTGRSVADLIRERLEAATAQPTNSVYTLTSELAGSLVGSRRAATNQRRRFRRA